MKHADFLLEIGTEELPPKALRGLMDALARNLESAVDQARLTRGEVHGYASPRRLAVKIDALALHQEDRETKQKGPPVAVAFNDKGEAQPAALAFAKKCGVSVDDLDREKTPKGEWLSYTLTEQGRSAAELLPELVEKALASLPIPRRMRWGAGDADFVRPVHWVVMLHGKQVVDANLLGVASGSTSRGHRFHAPQPIAITAPGKYLELLEKKGRVIADFERRRALVVDGVTAAAKAAGGRVVDGESLYDEVTALVEWPVPLIGRFDERYLELPREVVTATLTGHQRYFPIEDEQAALLPAFVTVANLESRDPDKVRDGNERVIRPRLADAAFFWESDRQRPLASREAALREVVYQRGLGSLFDKSARVAALAEFMADRLAADKATVARAAMLAKCDLLTGMVSEFPELQGTMGRYYAAADGETDAVAAAVGEHYQPRFAGDELPATEGGRILAVADKLDTLAGIFALGKSPSGNRDPFGLRRAALGVVRILVEGELDLDLPEVLREAVAAQPVAGLDTDAVGAELDGFISDRLRGYFLDRDAGLAVETFEAVLARKPASLTDFAQRLHAVQAFLQLPEAASLAAANKRIANILKKAGDDGGRSVQPKRLADATEKALYESLQGAEAEVRPLIAERAYTEALTRLAALGPAVDRFFDEVLVMAGDKALRENRLALLATLRSLFLDVADISRLAVT